MSQDFYVVLGISPDADLSQIKSAYRSLVKLYHPDTRPQPVERFLEISKAFEKICQERQEKEQDPAAQCRDQAQQEEGPLVVSRSGRPAAQAQQSQGLDPLPEQLTGDFTDLDEHFAGWVPGLFNRSRSTPRRKDLFVELQLAPAEARAGGMIPLRIPIEQRCPDCQGLPQGMVPCNSCSGRGRVVNYYAIEVSVPPGVTDGTQARIGLRDIGLPGTNLNVLVTVER